jgi:hypothetical protein
LAGRADPESGCEMPARIPSTFMSHLTPVFP